MFIRAPTVQESRALVMVFYKQPTQCRFFIQSLTTERKRALQYKQCFSRRIIIHSSSLKSEVLWQIYLSIKVVISSQSPHLLVNCLRVRSYVLQRNKQKTSRSVHSVTVGECYHSLSVFLQKWLFAMSQNKISESQYQEMTNKLNQLYGILVPYMQSNPSRSGEQYFILERD